MKLLVSVALLATLASGMSTGGLAARQNQNRPVPQGACCAEATSLKQDVCSVNGQSGRCVPSGANNCGTRLTCIEDSRLACDNGFLERNRPLCRLATEGLPQNPLSVDGVVAAAGTNNGASGGARNGATNGATNGAGNRAPNGATAGVNQNRPVAQGACCIAATSLKQDVCQVNGQNGRCVPSAVNNCGGQLTCIEDSRLVCDNNFLERGRPLCRLATDGLPANPLGTDGVVAA